MKNQLQIFILILTIPIISIGQIKPIKSEYLETDKLRYNVNNAGYTRTSHIESNVYFPHDTELERRTDGISGICLTTETSDGEVRAASTFFPDFDRQEYTAGIIDRSTGEKIIDEPYFDQIWKVEIHEIEQHKIDFVSNDLNSSSIPNSILKWPAKGNPFVTEYEIDFDLAPFYDQDSDGQYNPMQGDYPIALEEYPEFTPSEFTYSVIVESISQITFTPNINVEVEQISYVINCTDSPLSQGINYRWKVTNFNNETYQKLYLGIFEYGDMGCPFKNLTGTNLPTNSIYFYNNYRYEDGCAIPSNQREIVESTFSLSHDLNTTITGNPLDFDFANGVFIENPINFFKSKWSDGVNLTYGGSGYNPGSVDSTNYIMPDFPETTNGWYPDRNVLSNQVETTMLSGFDFGEMEIGESVIFDYSKFIYSDESESINMLFENYETKINNYKTLLQEALEGNSNCQQVDLNCTENCVWPGDINRDGIVDDIDNIYLSYAYNTNEGVVQDRDKIDIQWYGHQSQDWESQLIDVNMKHADTDGNGELNYKDFDNIHTNYQKSNESYDAIEDIEVTHADPKGISITTDVTEIDFSETVDENTLYIVTIDLGNENLEIENDLIGLTFDIRGDDRLKYNFFSSNFGFLDNPTYLTEIRDSDETLLEIINFDPINTSYLHTSTDDSSVSQGGKIMTIGFQIANDFETQNTNDRDTISFEIFNLTAISDQGDFIDIGIREKTDIHLSNVSALNTVSTVDNDIKPLSLYPNPSTSELIIDVEQKLKKENVKIYTLEGTLVYDQILTGNSIDISEFNSGMYILKLKSTHSTRTSTFIKI